MQREKKCVVHMGSPRTGTSAFQQWLVNNAAELRACDIHVPTECAAEDGNFGSLARAFEIPKDERRPGQQEKIRKFRKSIENSSHQTILISAERFNGSIARGRIGPIRALIQNNNYNPIAVLIARNQLDLINSMISFNWFRKLNDQKTVNELLNSSFETRKIDWHVQLKKIKKQKFDGRLGIYGRTASPDPIAKRVFDLAELAENLPEDFDYSIRTLNESVGEICIFSTRHLAKVLGDMNASVSNTDARKLSYALHATFHNFDDKPLYVYDDEQRRKVEDFFSRSNEIVANDLDEAQANALLNPSIKPRDRSPMTWQELSPEQADRVVFAFEEAAKNLGEADQLGRITAEAARTARESARARN